MKTPSCFPRNAKAFLNFAFAYGLHHIGRRTLGQQLSFHEVHVRCHMGEELMITLAEIIQSRLSILGHGKAVLRALTIASKQKLALTALLRKRLLLVLTKGLLAFAIHHFYQGLFVDITQLKLRKDKVVARIDIAIEFDDSGMSACLRQRANTGLFAYPIG